MGVWGLHPTKNDTAADFCHHLRTMPIHKWVEDGLNSVDYDEQRVAAWFLSRIGYTLLYPQELKDHLRLAIQRINDILADREYVSTWKDQQGFICDTKMMLKKLKNRLAKC